MIPSGGRAFGRTGNADAYKLDDSWGLKALILMPPPRSERRHYVLGLSVRPAVRSSGHVFLYYANMVQQIQFIIYTNIQSLRQIFFTKGQR